MRTEHTINTLDVLNFKHKTKKWDQWIVKLVQIYKNYKPNFNKNKVNVMYFNKPIIPILKKSNIY